MLHIGVVFVVFGIFLLGAGILPDDISTWNLFGMWLNVHFYLIDSQLWRLQNENNCLGKNTWWNELVCTGLFAIGLGIFLIVLNCLISKREEDDLEEYVQRQLTRSRSGHRLERDLWVLDFFWKCPSIRFIMFLSPIRIQWNRRFDYTSQSSH